MADKRKLKSAAVISCLALLVFYVPVMLGSYLTLGDCIGPDIIETLSDVTARQGCDRYKYF